MQAWREDDDLFGSNAELAGLGAARTAAHADDVTETDALAHLDELLLALVEPADVDETIDKFYTYVYNLHKYEPTWHWPSLAPSATRRADRRSAASGPWHASSTLDLFSAHTQKMRSSKS